MPCWLLASTDTRSVDKFSVLNSRTLASAGSSSPRPLDTSTMVGRPRLDRHVARDGRAALAVAGHRLRSARSWHRAVADQPWQASRDRTLTHSSDASRRLAERAGAGPSKGNGWRPTCATPVPGSQRLPIVEHLARGRRALESSDALAARHPILFSGEMPGSGEWSAHIISPTVGTIPRPPGA